MRTNLPEGDHLKRRMSPLCLASASIRPRKSRYRYTPLKQNQIRLLKLYPGEPNSQICCSIRIVDLLAYEDIKATSTIEGWERFDTISYVWGTRSNTVQITCSFTHSTAKRHPDLRVTGDNCSVHVTRNLASALQRFRDPQESQVLWADALCINQKDNNERAAQVKLMGLIYFKARCVRIWLGEQDELEEEHRAKCAVQLIQTYSRLYESCQPDPSGKKLQKLSETLFKTPTSFQQSHWTALYHLLERPWFTRVWVVQELGLSRNAIFYCGHDHFNRVELDRFERVLLYSKTGTALWRKLDLQMIHLGWNYWRSAWSNVRIELGEDPREAETLFDILRSVRGLQCTERKDMIYAFLGHPSAFKRQLLDVDPYYWYPTNYYSKRSTLVSPNYDKSYKFSRLCMDLAITSLRDYDIGLNVLSNIAHNCVTIDLKTASWVPRWDLMDTPSQFHGSKVYYEASKGLPRTTFAVRNAHAWRARPTLAMKALYLGKVWVTLPKPTSVQLEHIATTLAQLLGDIPKRGDVSYIAPPSLITYPYDDIFLLALATTLTAGLTTGLDFQAQPSDDYPNHHLTIFKAYFRQQQALDLGIQLSPEDEEHANFFAEEMARSATNRVPFLTMEGRFGLGPLISDFRDEVWLPMGAKMPFILRPTGNCAYKVVGQTFLDGVMRGEAVQGLNANNFGTIILV